MLKSFYNPDDQQHLEYHKELLKMAAQERFAQAGSPQGNSKRARMSLFEHLQRLFNVKPSAGTAALKHQKLR